MGTNGKEGASVKFGGGGGCLVGNREAGVATFFLISV